MTSSVLFFLLLDLQEGTIWPLQSVLCLFCLVQLCFASVKNNNGLHHISNSKSRQNGHLYKLLYRNIVFLTIEIGILFTLFDTLWIIQSTLLTKLKLWHSFWPSKMWTHIKWLKTSHNELRTMNIAMRSWYQTFKAIFRAWPGPRTAKGHR